MRNIVNKLFGLKLNRKISNNHSPEGRAARAAEVSQRCGTVLSLRMTQLQGLKLVGLQADRLA